MQTPLKAIIIQTRERVVSSQYSLSVVIPTYNRGRILLATIDLLLNQKDLPDEILIVDQTSYQDDDAVFKQLDKLSKDNNINWIQLNEPSIPAAMNKGLTLAKSDYVLFLDDDVTFDHEFIVTHRRAIELSKGCAHVGQILQPDETSKKRSETYLSDSGLRRDLKFPFSSDTSALIYNCMAGNLLVTKKLAIKCGGFDEQFSGVAYRFETEFCRRMIAVCGRPFHFVPSATLDHLKIPSGGTRDKASNFLTSSLPDHSQGDYYFALRCGDDKRETVHYILKRLFSSVCTRFYVRKPWWIPVRIVAEIRGLVAATTKFRQGTLTINSD